jgi:type VI protein secretion system component Hcp
MSPKKSIKIQLALSLRTAIITSSEVIFFSYFLNDSVNRLVSQNLDVEMTKSSQNPMQTMSMTFNEATWEHIEVADDTLAMFTAKVADK